MGLGSVSALARRTVFFAGALADVRVPAAELRFFRCVRAGAVAEAAGVSASMVDCASLRRVGMVFSLTQVAVHVAGSKPTGERPEQVVAA